MPDVAVPELTLANILSASTMLQCKPGVAALESDPKITLGVKI